LERFEWEFIKFEAGIERILPGANYGSCFGGATSHCLQANLVAKKQVKKNSKETKRNLDDFDYNVVTRVNTHFLFFYAL
jgi:hypothetical protein